MNATTNKFETGGQSFEWLLFLAENLYLLAPNIYLAIFTTHDTNKSVWREIKRKKVRKSAGRIFPRGLGSCSADAARRVRTLDNNVLNESSRGLNGVLQCWTQHGRWPVAGGSLDVTSAVLHSI